MSCYEFIDQQRDSYLLCLLCRKLQRVSARNYACRKQRTAGRPHPAPVAWKEALEKAFTRHQKRYGTRRLRVERQEEGYRVGRQGLRTAMWARKR